MAGRIPQDFIEDLITRADIVDIIDSRVKLKKAGRNHQACCPFHNEKTPSFSVSQEKQFYYCFGCGAKGNVISFLMEYDRLEFVEAVEELAKECGMTVPRTASNAPSQSPQQKSEREKDYQLMEEVTRYFQHQLKHATNAPKVIEYLKSRGLSGDVVKFWDIGYAPDQWDGVLSTFADGGKDKAKLKRLMTLKLVNENDNQRRYDFFRDRVMFPIRDKRGRVVAFGGRIIEGDGPKYLNSPETPIFHKGYELYGLHQARKENRKLARILVVEGYMDVVALSQFGISYAVAALGTATTPEHIQMMFKSCNEIVCCYDGDRAGREAAWRALENALPYLKDGYALKFLFLPDGEDPDTMIRKVGKDEFEQQLEKAVPVSTFFFDNLLGRHSLGSIEGKAAFKTEAQPLIEKIVGDNQREMMLSQLHRYCGNRNYDHEKNVKDANSQKRPRHTEYQAPSHIKQSPVRMMLRLLLDEPSLANEYPRVQITKLLGSGINGIDVLSDVHSYCVAHPNANTASLIEAFRDHPHFQNLGKLLGSPLEENLNLAAEYIACFKKLLRWHFDARLDELTARANLPQGLTDNEQKELQLLLQKR
ncbi:DNA primase [Glaciecola sp. XM2]|uniref:DNA primase n=1 Tax=Glaciecola sp. XM2 TaxID=1914931 RepID=UPI001BDEC3DE|nr:DNA primase [Glaciecola sp. XM2]MBT1450373.1 DNA primase [Glaciecola sp. XM2]